MTTPESGTSANGETCSGNTRFPPRRFRSTYRRHRSCDTFSTPATTCSSMTTPAFGTSANGEILSGTSLGTTGLQSGRLPSTSDWFTPDAGIQSESLI